MRKASEKTKKLKTQRWGNQYVTPLAIRSQVEVAKILGVTRPVVDRDEKRALAKLRKYFTKGEV